MASETAIEQAAKILRSGGLVAFPTETVYGLGADAFNERAVARVFEVKDRPRFDPLIVHIADVGQVERLAADFPPLARKLTERFWPGPLTLVLPKKPIVPDLVTAGCSTLALRLPDHPLTLELLRSANLALAGPSANPFGCISPTTAAHVGEQLGDRIDMILDGGPCRVGVESTVLQITDDRPILLRPGGTTLEEIENVVGAVGLPTAPAVREAPGGIASPGMLSRHYAPRTRLVVPTREAGNAAEEAVADGKRAGLLAFRAGANLSRYAKVEVLSPDGDLREATANFFAALRRLDAAGLDLIVADLFPESGLGRALNDRLRRAARS
jgi:L-threonylcarbamoyladenylate synthase